MIQPRLLSLFVGIGLLGSQPAAHLRAQSPAPVESLDEVFAKAHFAGMAVAVIKGDAVAVSRGLGHADIEAGADYAAATTQTLGSVSKLFIGVALIKAIEQGKLSLETEINEVLPFAVRNPHSPEVAIRVEHLATHTSGIRDHETRFWKNCYYLDAVSEDAGTRHLVEHYHARQGAPPALAAFLRDYFAADGALYGEANFLEAEAGARYEYSNVASSLAAYVVEVSTGMPFADFCREHVFDPLGMRSTAWKTTAAGPVGEVARRAATLYLDRHTPLPGYALSSYPDGGLSSSISDLSLFVLEMMRGYAGKSTAGFLSPESYRLMFQKRLAAGLPGLPAGSNSGVFWDWTKKGRLGHNGADPGLFTDLGFDPVAMTGSILLVNQELVNSPQRKTRLGHLRRLLARLAALERAPAAAVESSGR